MKNTSSTNYVGFKVKTTAPTFYTVRPNQLYLKPNHDTTVQGLYIALISNSILVTFMSHLKPGETFVPFKNHKFLIQAIQTPEITHNISDYVN